MLSRSSDFNAAYEAFPKSTSDNSEASVNRDRENDGEAEDDRCSSAPPVYTPAAAQPVYPEEPPPAYTTASAFQFSSYATPQFPPCASTDPFSNGDTTYLHHGHFGVLIDQQQQPASFPLPIVITQRPTDYLPLSLFNLVFCCLLFGVFGLVKSIATRSAVKQGDYSSAYVHSMEARNWNVAASITGTVIWTLVIVSIIVVSVV